MAALLEGTLVLRPSVRVPQVPWSEADEQYGWLSHKVAVLFRHLRSYRRDAEERAGKEGVREPCGSQAAGPEISSAEKPEQAPQSGLNPSRVTESVAQSPMFPHRTDCSAHGVLLQAGAGLFSCRNAPRPLHSRRQWRACNAPSAAAPRREAKGLLYRRFRSCAPRASSAPPRASPRACARRRCG